MGRLTIPRRTVLRGAGGAALALPALEMMGGSRAILADEIRPKRFVICHCGLSIGCSDMWRDGQTRAPTDIPAHDLVTPVKTGPGYEQTVGLKAIFDAQVQSDMGLVSGLHIPNEELFSSPPPAGSVGFHSTTHTCQYAGKTERRMCGGDGTPSQGNPCGPSADQIIADVISSPTQYMKTLPLMLESYYSRHFGEGSGVFYLSFVAGGPNDPKDNCGRTLAKAVPPYLNPSDIYNKLFDPNAPAVGTPQSMQALEAWKRDKTSVLNAVNARAKLLRKRLGRHDQLQTDRWLGHISTLENQIRRFDVSQCMAPLARDYTMDKDPKAGRYYDYAFNPEVGAKQEVYDTSNGYGNEKMRGEMQADLIAAAFACDRTRVVSWMMTGSQANLNMYPDLGLQSEMHAITHNNFAPHLAMCVNWHIAPVARLVKHLQEQTDVDGSRMIDNTVVLMFFEGGWGHQSNYPTPNTPEGKDRDAVYKGGGRYAHSTENMLLIVAGGKNLGIQAGQHVHYDTGPFGLNLLGVANSAQHPHPAQVVLTALRQLGYQGRLGDCPNDILPEMLKLQT